LGRTSSFQSAATLLFEKNGSILARNNVVNILKFMNFRIRNYTAKFLFHENCYEFERIVNG
jgi:hypothetical protein